MDERSTGKKAWRLHGAIALAVALLSATAAAVSAQEQARQQPIADVLSFLMTNQSVPTGDFVKDREAADATRDTISRALLVALGSAPISSSSGGFIYRLNPTLGTAERATTNFGPFLLERALTVGGDRVAFGVTWQWARFDRLDGHDLRDGTFITAANQFRDEAEPFDVEALTLHLETQTVTLAATAGVTDRLDLGVALPIVHVTLEGERANTYRGQRVVQALASAYTTGIGDIAVRAKVRLAGGADNGLAVGADVRLPTGREEDLLGAGTRAIRWYLVASAERGPVASHVTGGYAIGGLSDELSYGAALSLSATPRLTIGAELYGRQLLTGGRIVPTFSPHPLIAGVDTLRLLPTDATMAVIVLATGLKWNVGGEWVLNAGVSLPVTGNGLTARFVPSFALERSFGGR
jgi:hypothetical protein